MAEKNKKCGWTRLLLLWAAFLLIAGFIGCAVFYKYAAVYEASKPENTMDTIMAENDADDWHEILSASRAEGVSEFENADILFDTYMSGIEPGKGFSYRRDMSQSNNEQTVFVVYSGATKLCQVKLVPDPNAKLGFGRSEWMLDSISMGDMGNYLQAVTVQIDAPANEEVYLNGKLLGAEYISDEAVPCPKLTELESRFAQQPSFVRYTIAPLYGDIVVSDAEGNEIAPTGDVLNGVCSYTVSSEGKYVLKVEAPEGITISVNGIELSADEATGRDSSMFKGLEPFVSVDGYETLVYEYTGIYTAPVVSASYNGAELEPVVGTDGKYYYFYPSDEELSGKEKKAAEDFFQAYMNYSSSSFNGLNLNILLEHIKNGTELFNYVRNSRDAMFWASATDVEYDELRFDNFRYLSENCFSCTILFKADFTATSWYEEYSYGMQNGYKMVFINTDGIWRAATMTAFGS